MSVLLIDTSQQCLLKVRVAVVVQNAVIPIVLADSRCEMSDGEESVGCDSYYRNI